MTLLRGHFAWTLVVSVDASAQTVSDRLRFLADQGLVVSVLPVPEESPQPPVGGSYVLSVHGGDRPGIVSALTRILADHGGNVTDLTTRLTGGLYVVLAEVSIPAGTDVAALADLLAGCARSLGVAATLRPVDTDLL